MHLFISLAEDSEVCFDSCDKVAECGGSGNADDAAAGLIAVDVPQAADAGNTTPKNCTHKGGVDAVNVVAFAYEPYSNHSKITGRSAQRRNKIRYRVKAA